MSENNHELLVCRDAALGYEGQSVLEHLDLKVCAGDYLCIVGENGSGKSTLLKGLLGLLPPMSGEIWRAPDLRRGALGYLPQQTQAQRDFPATVYEVVLSGYLNQKGFRFFYTREQKSGALMNMGKLGVLELKDRCYRELSGGQQQRALLARALCAASRMLILDEPVTGLDPAAAQDLYKTLAYLNEKEGMAIVMVTHDLEAALQSARTVLHIGRSSWFFGTREEYLASPMGRRFQKGSFPTHNNSDANQQSGKVNCPEGAREAPLGDRGGKGGAREQAELLPQAEAERGDLCDDAGKRFRKEGREK